MKKLINRLFPRFCVSVIKNGQYLCSCVIRARTPEEAIQKVKSKCIYNSLVRLDCSIDIEFERID